MPTYIRYTDFLKDKQFIRWQLAPNRELEAHWEDFIKKNQHLNYELQQAIDYLKTNGLNKSTLNEDERLRLLNEIKSTVERSLKKNKTPPAYPTLRCFVRCYSPTYYWIKPLCFSRKRNPIFTGTRTHSWKSIKQ